MSIDVWSYNFAKNQRVRDAVKESICSKIKTVMEERKLIEEKWLEFFNMWNVIKDGNHDYTGRANLYIPEVRKNVESQARQFVDSAFPREDFFSCIPGNNGSEEGALLQKKIRTKQIDDSKLRIKYHVYARQLCLLGTSPVYVPWTKIEKNVFRSKKEKEKLKKGYSKIQVYNGPDFVPKSLFKFFALDPNDMDLDGRLEKGCFENEVVTKKEILKTSDLFGVQEILEGSSNAYAFEAVEKDIRMMESMNLLIGKDGYSAEVSLDSNEENVKRGTYLKTVVYVDAVLPEAVDRDLDEDPKEPIPLMIEIYNNEHVALVKRNQFYHQRPPYLVGKYILPNFGEFYGQGIPWAIQYMQHMVNSKAEQTMDSSTLANNPLAFIDPAYADPNAEFDVFPGAKWFINPQGVKLGNIPDTSHVGYEAISQIRAQIADFSDRAPSLPTQLQGKARTATQADIIDRAVTIDNKSFQLQNELLVLNPLMEMWESLTDQYIEEDQVLMILGPYSSDWEKVLYTKNKTLGSYVYNWKVSSTFQSKAIVARQMIDMLKIINTMPPEDKKQLTFNPTEFMKLLWTENLGMPDHEKIFGKSESEKNQDPQAEHKLLELGVEISVKLGDNDQEHLQEHDVYISKIKDKKVLSHMVLHMSQHSDQIEKKMQMMKEMVQKREQLMASVQQAQGNSVGSGNRTQLSPNSSTGDMASGIRA